MNFQRYAIFFTPDDGPFSEFGARWLGWDIETGTARAHPEISGLPAPVAQLTKSPRRYGFHATLKPPFRLAQGHNISDLHTEIGALASQIAPICLPKLELVALGRFLVLVAPPPAQDLINLASTFVRELDGFRAPPSAQELAARRKPHLTPSQNGNLTEWGYPFVMDDFRFHITLTGPLAKPERASALAALAPVLEKVVPRPFSIASVTLAGECDQGRFHQISKHPLSG